MSFGQLQAEYEMSQVDVAKKLHLNVQTVRSAEKSGIEKLKKALSERGLKLEDLIEVCR